MSTFAYSYDEVVYHGAFETAEAAAHEGLWALTDAAWCWVGECKPPRQPEDSFTRYEVEEFFQERVSSQDDYSGEWCEDWYEATKDQEEELSEEIRKAIAAWLDKHSLRPKFYCVEAAEKWVRGEGGNVVRESEGKHA